MERSRRKKSAIIPTFQYQEISKIPFTQEKFLSNESNKDNLIKTISHKLESEGFICKQAAEDADALIINTAIQVAKQDDKTVIVVGQDIDLLILLHQLISNGLRIFFHKPGSGNQKDEFYSSNCFVHESYTNIIAFIHAFSGCDSISGLAGKGKKTIVQSLLSNKNLLNLASIFFEKDADQASIAKNGCQLIAGIYQSKKKSDVSLNTLRFELYQKAINKSSFKLEKLPPTEGAAAQHSYRVYYQLQTWLSFFNEQDNNKAKQWGWSERTGRLVPTFISDDLQLIPDTLLKSISCSCETGCNKRCGCRKHGLKCTNLCINCHDNCSNREEITFENESDAEGIAEEPPIRRDENRGLEVDGDVDPSDSESCVDEEDA